MFKFNSFVKQSKSNTEGGEGAAAAEALNKGPAADDVKPDAAQGSAEAKPGAEKAKPEEDKKSKWYWGTAAKVTLGVVGTGVLVGAGFLVASAMRASENEAIAAVGDAVAAGAGAVADATAAVVEAAYRK